jgi:hypothetical protein
MASSIEWLTPLNMSASASSRVNQPPSSDGKPLYIKCLSSMQKFVIQPLFAYFHKLHHLETLFSLLLLNS